MTPVFQAIDGRMSTLLNGQVVAIRIPDGALGVLKLFPGLGILQMIFLREVSFVIATQNIISSSTSEDAHEHLLDNLPHMLDVILYDASRSIYAHLYGTTQETYFFVFLGILVGVLRQDVHDLVSALDPDARTRCLALGVAQPLVEVVHRHVGVNVELGDDLLFVERHGWRSLREKKGEERVRRRT